MDAALTITDAVVRVAALREAARERPALHAAIVAVKRVQSMRFAGTYADMLASDTYRGAARFFLDELYSDRDYAQRDAQFARIAKPLGKYFPPKVVATAVALAELHVLTEEMDHRMALAWDAQEGAQGLHGNRDTASRYLAAWRQVGGADVRATQLQSVLQVGAELERLVRLPGLRMALRMMRSPAKASGMGDLQRFLEAGFDTFAELVKGRDQGAQGFLKTIAARETRWIEQLFQAPHEDALQQLSQCLAAAQN